MKKIAPVLAIAFLSRLYHITFPVLGWHSWRQSDTASIARNFFENGFNILYPQVNWGGTGTGYVEAEFHIYPFIVSLLYAVFGVNDFWGRIVSVIFSVLTVYGVFILVKKYMNESVAFWSALIYAIIPLNIYYGRAFMPESSLLMCSVYSVYFFSEWLDKEKVKYFVLAIIFTAFAILIKLPALYLGLPLLFLAYQKFKAKSFLKPALWIFVILVIIPVVLWYYHAHQLFINNGVSFGIWTYGSDKWGMFDLLLKPSFYNDLFLKSIAERHLTYPGFILLIIGLFIKRKNPAEKLFDFWLLAVLIYFLIVAQGNLAQEYYQLPFILPAVVFIGKALDWLLPFGKFKEAFSMSKLKSSFGVLCLVMILVLSYLRVAHTMGGENPDSSVFKMANDIKLVTQKNDLIITVCDGNPVYLYHADRKGWVAPPGVLDEKFINEHIKDGAKVLAGEKSFFEGGKLPDSLLKILNKYKIIHNDERYFVVLLKPGD